MNRLMKAIKDWNWEVETHAARFIREGTPPNEALREARRLVSQRRGDRAAKRAEKLQETKK